MITSKPTCSASSLLLLSLLLPMMAALSLGAQSTEPPTKGHPNPEGVSLLKQRLDAMGWSDITERARLPEAHQGRYLIQNVITVTGVEPDEGGKPAGNAEILLHPDSLLIRYEINGKAVLAPRFDVKGAEFVSDEEKTPIERSRIQVVFSATSAQGEAFEVLKTGGGTFFFQSNPPGPTRLMMIVPEGNDMDDLLFVVLKGPLPHHPSVAQSIEHELPREGDTSGAGDDTSSVTEHNDPTPPAPYLAFSREADGLGFILPDKALILEVLTHSGPASGKVRANDTYHLADNSGSRLLVGDRETIAPRGRPETNLGLVYDISAQRSSFQTIVDGAIAYRARQDVSGLPIFYFIGADRAVAVERESGDFFEITLPPGPKLRSSSTVRVPKSSVLFLPNDRIDGFYNKANQLLGQLRQQAEELEGRIPDLSLEDPFIDPPIRHVERMRSEFWKAWDAFLAGTPTSERQIAETMKARLQSEANQMLEPVERQASDWTRRKAEHERQAQAIAAARRAQDERSRAKERQKEQDAATIRRLRSGQMTGEEIGALFQQNLLLLRYEKFVELVGREPDHTTNHGSNTQVSWRGLAYNRVTGRAETFSIRVFGDGIIGLWQQDFGDWNFTLGTSQR